jgi:sterol desaturase/sphingolipid hydroxylase (fatty acid hydroxylase superfamily)
MPMTEHDTAFTVVDAIERVTEHFMNVLYFDLGRYLIAAGVMTVFLLIFRRWAGRRRIQTTTLITLIWQTALIVLAHDAYFYWMHRAMHSRRLFRATHLHHHKSRTPTP